jgi:hypothetical protein
MCLFVVGYHSHLPSGRHRSIAGVDGTAHGFAVAPPGEALAAYPEAVDSDRGVELSTLQTPRRNCRPMPL